MRFIKRFFLFVLFLVILLLIGLAVGKNAIFESVLNGALDDLRKERNLQISYASANLGLFGGVSLEKVKAVDIPTETVVVDGLNLDVDFGWFGLIGSPITIGLGLAIQRGEQTLGGNRITAGDLGEILPIGGIRAQHTAARPSQILLSPKL